MEPIDSFANLQPVNALFTNFKYYKLQTFLSTRPKEPRGNAHRVQKLFPALTNIS